MNEETEDQTRSYLLSNSSGSNGEELDSCNDSSRNDSSSDDSDKDPFISDDGSDCANVFMKSIYKGSNLYVGASCILLRSLVASTSFPVKLRMIYSLYLSYIVLRGLKLLYPKLTRNC